LWRSGKNGWVVLASRLEDFEEHAFKLCELIVRGDRRIGRMTRAAQNGMRGVAQQGNARNRSLFKETQ
jgi:hypothetical protein